jgi:hypothetical protein
MWQIDGRNRQAACELVGVEPRYAVLADDPVAYIISTNVTRRHLNNGQCAIAIVRARKLTYSGVSQNRGAADGAKTSLARVKATFMKSNPSPNFHPNSTSF